MKRQSPLPELNQPLKGFTADELMHNFLKHGGNGA
jgi:hypothetical protein